MHQKNRTGVIISGRICASHFEMTSASTYCATLQCRNQEVVKSASNDKWWAVREPSAKIDKFDLLLFAPALGSSFARVEAVFIRAVL